MAIKHMFTFLSHSKYNSGSFLPWNVGIVILMLPKWLSILGLPLHLLRFNFSQWICLFGVGQRDGSISIGGTWTHDFRLDRAALANWTAIPAKVSYKKITINLFNYSCATPNHLVLFQVLQEDSLWGIWILPPVVFFIQVLFFS